MVLTPYFHLLNNSLLRAYYVPGSVRGSGDRSASKTGEPLLCGASILEEPSLILSALPGLFQMYSLVDMHRGVKFLIYVLSLSCAGHGSEHFVCIISLASVAFPTKLYEGGSINVLSLQTMSPVWMLAHVYNSWELGPSSAHLIPEPMSILIDPGSLS